MSRSFSDPASGVVEVTPDDDDFINARALYIGTGGDVTVVAEDGTDATFVGVPSGSILPVRCVKVMATGTDAENIVALL